MTSYSIVDGTNGSGMGAGGGALTRNQDRFDAGTEADTSNGTSSKSPRNRLREGLDEGPLRCGPQVFSV
jgi:hypothetical protein